MTARFQPIIRRALVDTSGYFALADVSDREYEQARDITMQRSLSGGDVRADRVSALALAQQYRRLLQAIRV